MTNKLAIIGGSGLYDVEEFKERELLNIKIPFISIPLPSSADNHQFKNAEFYVKRGYGYLLEEKDETSIKFI